MLQAILNNQPIALIDMPDLLLRMKVVSSHSLAEIQQIFNYVLNKVAKNGSSPGLAALYYFPEVFAKPRDEYVAAMLFEMATDMQGDKGLNKINAYLGNLQIKPVSRLWNTYKLDRTYENIQHRTDLFKP